MSYHWIRIFESESAFENYIQKGTFVVMELKGEKVCLTRTDKGAYAVQDRCPHNGASLSKGFCTAQNEIVCPLHRYSYDLETGKGTSGGGYALKTYPITIREDGVYVGIKAKWWES